MIGFKFINFIDATIEDVDKSFLIRLDELEKLRADKRRSDFLDEQQVPEEAVSDATKPTDIVDMELCGDEDRDATADCSNDVENIVATVKDRSLEEARAELYESNTSSVSDTFNTFQFWREPVASLVLPETSPAESGNEKPEPEVAEAEVSELLKKPSETEFEEEDDEMEIEPLFGDEDDFEDSRVEELHKLENHLKRVLDKDNQEMDHLTKELRDAKLGGNFFLITVTRIPIIH